MNEVRTTAAPARLAWTQVAVFVAGLFYLAVGLALLFFPQWFFATIGTFPPYNRHYMGDLGAFVLPLGVGLLLAAPRPAAHRGLVGLVAVASLLHALNHAYDDWLAGSPLAHWLEETIPLLIFAGLLLLAYRALRPASSQ
ncbi:MAG: hypothetical protein L0332_12910 [Chloroflexi bacterium]|nr:hypothetical protein [Chloroflexota bacterium]MCI0574831.1 hypothetical protein [Chloroflexota bacterium]MCI0645951.1 hypothetical protein [Chloroflexota bacterium]MCI0727606.1 hypothetical protein [Chloroflexota bacterium]